MTDEQRLARLEKQATNLRLISSGGGNVLGVPRFGRTGANVQERIAGLQKWTNEFRLEGDNVRVAGSFKTGYIIEGQADVTTS